MMLGMALSMNKPRCPRPPHHQDLDQKEIKGKDIHQENKNIPKDSDSLIAADNDNAR